MKVQSLSLVVPATCPNKCPFCISRMNTANSDFSLYNNCPREMIKQKLEFARDNSCNILMVTSTGEVLNNKQYLIDVLDINKKLSSPFKWIELQTSGYKILDMSYSLLKTFSWISLSMVDPLDFNNNKKIMGLSFNLEKVIFLLYSLGINLRASINLTDVYKDYDEEKWKNFFRQLNIMTFKQVTFRLLYNDGFLTNESEWIEKHAIKETDASFLALKKYIKREGKVLSRLPFGKLKMSVDDLSVVVDDDCMATNKENIDVYKYLILRPNGKLYTLWHDNSSLLF